MGKKRPVVQSAEEAHRSAIADQLRNAGDKNFERVYGQRQPGAFSLNKDMDAMGGVKMMTPEQIAKNKQAGAETQMPVEEEHIPVVPPGVDFVPESTPSELQSPELDESMLPPEPPAEEQPAEEQKQEKQEQLSEDPDKRAEQVAEFLAKTFPSSPTADQLKEWRRLHGGAFMVHISDRVFIFRYLKRQEWIQINANPKAGELTEDDVELDIFNRCMLWPHYGQIQMAGMPAGGIGMVVQQIRLQSLFLDPSYVAQMTIKI